MNKQKASSNLYIVGNPNTGKSSLFNSLTGLQQKISNFPGVTVEKKQGISNWKKQKAYTIIDLPGIYSLYPRKDDEWESCKVIKNIAESSNNQDIILHCIDATNLRRNLLLYSQLKDLGIPIIVCLTMVDVAKRKGLQIDDNELSRLLGSPVLKIHPNKKKTLKVVFTFLDTFSQKAYQSKTKQHFIDPKIYIDKSLLLDFTKKRDKTYPIYAQLHTLFTKEDSDGLSTIEEKVVKAKTRIISNEILQRYKAIDKILAQCVISLDINKKIRTKKIDDILLHSFWGYVILAIVLFAFFQCIFLIAQYPMDWVDNFFLWLINWTKSVLPDNILSDFITGGVLTGLNAILVFVPQIMLLFGLVNILEDSGYMARISFLTDKIMRKFGLSGKSIVPLIGGMACAVPSIMATRTIENKKERILSILVTPLISCSARLPVFILLISLVIPNIYIFHFMNIQGLILMGLYLLSFVSAFVTSYFLNMVLKIKNKSFFLLELPNYMPPRLKNIGLTMIQKTRIFVFDAGKMILLMSLIIWLLSSFSSPAIMSKVEKKYDSLMKYSPLPKEEIQKAMHQEKLETSFAGMIGKYIEPAIKPLGFDWKIGITLITSFAAREVFVSTISTLYQEDSESEGLITKLRQSKDKYGNANFTLANGLSLILFFAFALQCMSTLAIVKRELRSWKYPVFQFVLFFIFAYIASFITYQLLS